jgi:hypothetical protein
VLARYELPGHPVFLVSRQMGRGEVVFCSSGLLSSWNTLPKTNAVLIFDRMLRGMIQRTLDERNLPATDRLALPLPHVQQKVTATLTRPGQLAPQNLDVSYIGAQQRGLTLTGLLARGVYRVKGFQLSGAGDQGITKPAWEMPFVVAGSGEESDLTGISRGEVERLAGNGRIHWVETGEYIDLSAAAAHGQNSWWWLTLGVLVILLLEMSVLAWPS